MEDSNRLKGNVVRDETPSIHPKLRGKRRNEEPCALLRSIHQTQMMSPYDLMSRNDLENSFRQISSFYYDQRELSQQILNALQKTHSLTVALLIFVILGFLLVFVFGVLYFIRQYRSSTEITEEQTSFRNKREPIVL
uniref:Plexin cytoplasmic RasGAP domain-containing protein n=1 Tax=Syphacia muris TaxID=451379 RepID=A0A0N5B1I9_9BILA